MSPKVFSIDVQQRRIGIRHSGSVSNTLALQDVRTAFFPLQQIKRHHRGTIMYDTDVECQAVALAANSYVYPYGSAHVSADPAWQASIDIGAPS